MIACEGTNEIQRNVIAGQLIKRADWLNQPGVAAAAAAQHVQPGTLLDVGARG
jgi:hypothetical protein